LLHVAGLIPGGCWFTLPLLFEGQINKTTGANSALLLVDIGLEIGLISVKTSLL